MTPLARTAPTDAVAEAQRIEQLAARAAQGDRGAFDELYARTVGRVYGVCLRLSGDRASAESLTQDTYVRAWRKLDTFRAESAFTTWLHRLAVNVVLNDARQAQRRSRALALGVEALDGPARATEPGLRVDMERAIASLPAGARTVLVLHDIEGYRHHEIAHLLGIAEGTAKAQLHRARQLLQQRLGR